MKHLWKKALTFIITLNKPNQASTSHYFKAKMLWHTQKSSRVITKEITEEIVIFQHNKVKHRFYDLDFLDGQRFNYYFWICLQYEGLGMQCLTLIEGNYYILTIGDVNFETLQMSSNDLQAYDSLVWQRDKNNLSYHIVLFSGVTTFTFINHKVSFLYY